MGGVARHKNQAVSQCDSGDHRICPSDGLAGPFKVSVDASGKFGTGDVELQDFLGGQIRQEGPDAIVAVRGGLVDRL